MPLDSATFKIRTLSAILFAAVMLTGLLWNKESFIVLFTVIHFGCWYEFIKIMKKINPQNYKIKSLLGLLYITLPIVLIIIIRTQGPIGISSTFLKIIPCAIIFSIWINDTMAYIVGSIIGKTPLSPISPKKTWEGTLGGIVLCVLIITIAGSLSNYYSWVHWLAISLICAVAGTFGDLVESKLKRMAHIKDSGSMMPGHGGFLDRFDSMLFAIPIVFSYYYLFLK